MYVVSTYGCIRMRIRVRGRIVKTIRSSDMIDFCGFGSSPAQGSVFIPLKKSILTGTTQLLIGAPLERAP